MAKPYHPPPDTAPVSRPSPSAVTYHIPTTTSNLRTTIVLPSSSTWSSGLHWHNSHTEYLRLVHGAIYVRLGGDELILSAVHGGIFSSKTLTGKKTMDMKPEVNEGVIQVKRGVRHCWHRASHHYSTHPTSGSRPSDVDEEVIVEEWTSPADISKPLFFWNLNSAIVAQPSNSDTLPIKIARSFLGMWWIELQLFVIFKELDNWPVLLDCGRDEVELLLTWLVLAAAAVAGRLIGVKAVSEERTPKELWDVWQKDKKFAGTTRIHS